jgi:hypothetical protein
MSRGPSPTATVAGAQTQEPAPSTLGASFVAEALARGATAGRRKESSAAVVADARPLGGGEYPPGFSRPPNAATGIAEGLRSDHAYCGHEARAAALLGDR